jgi:hypothetical protein
MNYELAKKLKEAGFKFHHEGSKWSKYIFPTLEELIEACGNEFKGLMVDTEETWHAISIVKTDDNSNISGIGETLEEAVANLWLNLNKKDS